MADPLATSFTLFADRPDRAYKELGAALVDSIWGLPRATDSRRYLEHYKGVTLHRERGTLPFQTHQDVVDLVGLIKTGKALAFRLLRASISVGNPRWLTNNNSDAEVRAAIRLAVDLWLMVPTESWVDDDSSLCDFIPSCFPPVAAQTIPINTEISFTARSLEVIGDLNLEWTSRISEHLRFDRRSARLCVFRHASFVGRRRDDGQDDIYPAGLLRETAETMALLVPLSDSSKHKLWNRRVRKKAEVDVEIGIAAYPYRNLGHYNFWRERLNLVQSHYDSTAPNKFSQWVHDRRDGNRFWTFWLTVAAIVLALIFGAVQSVTGILQVIRS